MNFEYFYQQTASDSIDLEDIGNCCIEVTNDQADQWYFRTKTDLGWTVIEQFGPLTADLNDIGYSFNYSYWKMEYNQQKIHSNINRFLNDPKRNITQAREIDTEEFEDRLNSIEKE